MVPILETTTFPALDSAPMAPVDKAKANAARHAALEARRARHAVAWQSTRNAALDDKGTRAAQGFSGREGYTVWNVNQREAIRDALDGETVVMVVSPLNLAVKNGRRCTITTIVHTAGHTVALRSEAVLALGTTLEIPAGTAISMRLRARRDSRRDGSPFTGFVGDSVDGSPWKINSCQVQASRFVRLHASAL